MPTQRRLINKKAYDELVLIKKFLEKQDWTNRKYECGLDLDDNLRERFFVNILEDTSYTVLNGKNYSEITKALMEYLNG